MHDDNLQDTTKDKIDLHVSCESWFIHILQ